MASAFDQPQVATPSSTSPDAGVSDPAGSTEAPRSLTPTLNLDQPWDDPS